MERSYPSSVEENQKKVQNICSKNLVKSTTHIYTPQQHYMSYKDIFIQRHITYKLERFALAGREENGSRDQE